MSKKILTNAKIRRHYEATGQKVPPTIEAGNSSKATRARISNKIERENKSGVTVSRQKYNEIKPFVNFRITNFDKITPSQKGIITKVRNELSPVLATGSQTFRPRSKKNQAIMREEMGVKSKHIVAMPFVSDDGKTTKIRIKNGQIHVESVYADSMIFRFDKKRLADEQEDYIDRSLEKLNEEGWRRYRVICGSGELSNGEAFTRRRARTHLVRLINEYPKESGNHYHGNWLHGVKAVRYKENVDVEEAGTKRKEQRATGYGRSKRAAEKRARKARSEAAKRLAE